MTAPASVIALSKSCCLSVVCWYPTKPSASGARSLGKRMRINSDAGVLTLVTSGIGTRSFSLCMVSVTICGGPWIKTATC
jgi:hypothetical protein